MPARAVDWYPGRIPPNIAAADGTYLGSSYSFVRYRSRRPDGLVLARGATLGDATVLDVGPAGRVMLGAFAMVTAARFVCDAEIILGDHALVSWDVVLMDSFRVGDGDPPEPPRPVRLGAGSWVGFGSCILPGVTVGEGAIVGARSVVAADVPPYTLVAGNPARIIRRLA